jgi:peroxiredoxin Q/BCP
MLSQGDQLPAFKLQNQNGEFVDSNSLLGSWFVIYFYPKDDTPGCTQESCDFRDNLSELSKLNVKVFGISKDSVQSHQKFAYKFNLNFSILSDESGALCEAFGVWVEKNMYGKKSYGIQRSTFIIDPQGTIAHSWPKVSVESHVNEVKAKILQLLENNNSDS